MTSRAAWRLSISCGGIAGLMCTKATGFLSASERRLEPNCRACGSWCECCVCRERAQELGVCA